MKFCPSPRGQKKGHQKFWELNDILGGMLTFFREGLKRSFKNFEKIWPPVSEVLDPLVSMLDGQSRGLGFKSQPLGAEILFGILVPHSPPSSQLSCDEFTDCALSMGIRDGEGEDWQSDLLCRG